MAKDNQKQPENNENENKNETDGEEKEELNKENLDLFQSSNTNRRNISDEMENSYLEYAMSVIVARALPDIRDGLKPVHRRILFAMNEMGLKSSSSFRKSAAVVGEVLAKYHPHGDAAVYDSMVRMAQEFAEAKMEKITDEMLLDIDKETVDFRDNYDGRFKEPKVLPTKLPQLLLNGSTGIAVGMATSIPPHNLGELIDGIMHLSNKWLFYVVDLNNINFS